MLSLDDLLAPITSSVFHADYDDRKPLHIRVTDRAVWAGALVRP